MISDNDNKVKILLIDIAIYTLLCIGTFNYCNRTIKNIVHFSAWTKPAGIFALLLLVAVGVSYKPAIKKIRFNKTFWIGWMLCFGMMFASSYYVHVKTAYYIWSIEGVLVFPIIFLLWSSGDAQRVLYERISKDAVIAAYLFVLASFMMVPFFEKPLNGTFSEYIGLAVNPNNNGMIILTFFAAALYRLMTDKKLKSIYYAFPMAVCFAIAVISECRTAVLAMILQMVCAAVFCYLNYVKKGQIKVDILKILTVFIVAVAIAFVSGTILVSFDNMNLEVHAADAVEETQESPSEHIFNQLNDLSSGRIRITQYYVNQSTFWGNGSPKGPIIEEIPASKWSFNNAVDILYVSGVLPFVGCIVWILAVLWYIIRWVFGKGNVRKEHLLCILILINYFTEFVLEVTLYPSKTHITTMAYLCLIPIACMNAESSRTFEEKHRCR